MLRYLMIATVFVSCTVESESAPLDGGNDSRPTDSRPAPQEKSASEESRVDHGAWDRIVKAHVRDGRVDYLVIRRDHLAALDGYLDALAKVKASALPRQERLAFHINLYNATMVRLIVGRYRDGYSPSENGFGVFKEKAVRLEGGKVSLDHLEHEVIRPMYREPRIHVALVCGAVSCPPLLARAYAGSDLEAVLEANMKRFVNDASRNPIDRGGRRLRLSEIFKWFADDFGGAGAIAAYVDRYHEAPVSKWPVSYVKYSWTLNAARPEDGRWVRVTAPKLVLGAGLPALPRNAVLSVIGEADGRLRVRVPLHPGKEATVDAGSVEKAF